MFLPPVLYSTCCPRIGVNPWLRMHEHGVDATVEALVLSKDWKSHPLYKLKLSLSHENRQLVAVAAEAEILPCAQAYH